MRQRYVTFTIFILFTLTGLYAIPLDENHDEIKNISNSSSNSSESVHAEKPVTLDNDSKSNESSTTTTTTTNAPISDIIISTTEKFIEVKILETSNSSSTSIKKEPTPTRTTKVPNRTRTTKATKTPRTRKTTTTTTPAPKLKDPAIKQPITRQDWLKLIETEMATYDKKSGSSPITNKNLTIISERILKYLVENGTQIGISLREQKDGTIKFMKANVTSGDKIYGEGTESKFPPVLEFVVQRIQAYFSVYAHEDHSRPANVNANEGASMDATLREDTDDKDTSSLSNDEVIDQLEDEISEFIGSDVVKNVTQIKLPSLIKSAYEKIQAWFVPGKPAAKEEAVEDSDEEASTEVETGSDKKPTKKPSLIKGAYDAIEAILSVFEDIDVSDEEEKVETAEKTSDAEVKESQDDLDDTDSIKETVGENLYDFLKLAYTLYDEDES